MITAPACVRATRYASTALAVSHMTYPNHDVTTNTGMVSALSDEIAVHTRCVRELQRAPCPVGFPHYNHIRGRETNHAEILLEFGGIPLCALFGH